MPAQRARRSFATARSRRRCARAARCRASSRRRSSAATATSTARCDNNVPASICIDAGADFVIACDVVPLPGVPRGKHRRGLAGAVLDVTQVNRLSDAVRSLYWLTSDSGQRQASVADVVFSPDLAEYEPWDFPRAKAIVARAELQLEAWLPATVARYAALSQNGRADG